MTRDVSLARENALFYTSHCDYYDVIISKYPTTCQNTEVGGGTVLASS